MLHRPLAVALLLAVLGLGTRAAADGLDEAARRRALAEAFKPLRLPPAAKLEKEVAPLLPPGIVIEAEPFHALIQRVSRPFAALFDAREQALEALQAGPSVAEAELLEAAWKTVEAECEDLAERVDAIEARYAEVYNLEYDVSGEKERQTRKLAAVLVPLYRGLTLREARVAAAAAEALAGLRDGAGLSWLVTAATGAASPGFRAVAVDALGRVGGAEAGAALRQVAARDAESPLRLRALAALGLWKVAEVREAIVQALSDPAWEVRALAVAMCAQARLVEAAGPLIGALEREDGRLRQDIDDALMQLVGVRMYGDVALWKAWWQQNEEAVAAKARALAAEGAYDRPLGPVESWDAFGASEAGAPETKGTTSAFYGIPTTSRHVVFVVDISRSMSDPAQARPSATGGRRDQDPYAEPKGQTKLQIAQWQLHRAIAGLPAQATFAIVVYSESYRVWLRQMTEASPKAKAKAHDFVDGLVANGTTNIADAFDRALELAGVLPLPGRGKTPRAALAADTIYLLSDGDPNRGRVTDLTALLDDLGARARAVRIVVHTIGIGEAAGSSFLESLALRTGGRCVGLR